MDPELSRCLSSVSVSLEERKLALLEKRGAKKQLDSALASEEKSLEESRAEQHTCHQAYLFLMTAVSERRDQVVKAIETMATTALRSIYGPGYRLKFETFEEARAAGANNFKMEIHIISPQEGNDMSTSLTACRGGGLVEMTSAILRISSLDWLGYEGPLILDETFNGISRDRKVRQNALMLRELSRQTGRQMIFITHMVENFAPISDLILEVGNIDGVASVENRKYVKPASDIDEDEEYGENPFS